MVPEWGQVPVGSISGQWLPTPILLQLLVRASSTQHHWIYGRNEELVVQIYQGQVRARIRQ